MVQVLITDAMDRINKSGKTAIMSFATGDEQRMMLLGPEAVHQIPHVEYHCIATHRCSQIDRGRQLLLLIKPETKGASMQKRLFCLMVLLSGDADLLGLQHLVFTNELHEVDTLRQVADIQYQFTGAFVPLLYQHDLSNQVHDLDLLYSV